MFRVAVITNENEVAHSSFADTMAILKRPVTLGKQKTDSYIFSEFDKFTVVRLFQDGHQDHLLGFDSLIVATNATNNNEVITALRRGQTTLDEFINAGKGVLVLSQKKLSATSADDAQKTGFLPERFDYALCDRPEASSAAGLIAIAENPDRLLCYPNAITQELVERRCANNSFMEHRYRSVLMPSNVNQYVAVLVDRDSAEHLGFIPMGFPPGRPILIRTANSKERVVATSMALDWAGHDELLENILIYITEGHDQIAVVRKTGTPLDDPIDVYTARARAAKLPIREYFDIDTMNAKLPNHRAIIVSPAYSIKDAKAIWDNLAKDPQANVDLYHLSVASREDGFQIQRRSLSNSANYHALSGALWVSRSFAPTLWGKSIWTYNYALPMMNDLDLDVSPFAAHVLADIETHIKVTPTGASYDNVPNATAQLLELLSSCYLSLGDSNLSPKPVELVQKCETWIIELLNQPNRLSPRDQLSLLNSLNRAGRLDAMETAQLKVLQSISVKTLQHYSGLEVGIVETVELTQWLELELFVLRLASASTLPEEGMVQNILVELKRRQQVEGGWKNVSVSGDVLIALLRAGNANPSLNDKSSVKDMLVKGVEYLVGSFDEKLGNWSNDINATAKAARALVMFDRHRGLSSADFVADIHARAKMLQFSEFCLESLRHDGALLKLLSASEATLKISNGIINGNQEQISRAFVRERALRIFAFGFLVIALVTSASLGLVIWILSASYPSALKGILGKWDEYLVSGFVSILLTLVFMGAYTFAQRRLMRPKLT